MGKAGKAGTGWSCLLSTSKKLRVGQGESSGSVAESAQGGDGAMADSLSPGVGDTGKVYSCVSAYSAVKYAEVEVVMLFRDGATAALGRVVVVAFRKMSHLACPT